MRGVHLPSFVIAAVLLLFTVSIFDALQASLYCDYVEEYDLVFDIPPCRGIVCVKKAYPEPNAYAQAVGMAWDRANRIASSYTELRHACGEPFTDVNGLPIVRNIKRAKNAALAVIHGLEDVIYFSSLSNQYAVYELQSLIDTLEAAGIEESTEGDWLDLFSDLVLSVEDMNRGSERTELGKLWKRIAFLRAHVQDPAGDRMFVEYIALTLAVLGANTTIPLAIPFLRLFETSTEEASLLASYIGTYVNTSVGASSSVRYYLARLRERYRTLKEETDKKVRDLKIEFEKRTEKVEKAVISLLDENLNILTSFLEARTYLGKLRTDLSHSPALALALTNRYSREFEKAYREYVSGYRFLAALEKMKRTEAEMRSLESEVERLLSSLEASVESCVEEVKGYRFADGDVRSLAMLELVKAKTSPSLTGRVVHCEKALHYVALDEKYRDAIRAFKECVERYEAVWGTAPSCTGTPLERLQCCERASERKLTEFMSSEQYLRYVDLYDTLFTVALEYGLDDVVMKLSLLPRRPSTPDELYDSMSKLIGIADVLSRQLSLAVGTEWNGYLSTDTVTTVTLHLYNPLSLPVRGEAPIPFSYLGFSVEGNGILVSVKENKVEYRGRGEAYVHFLAAPVELEEKVLSSSEGHIRLRLFNTHRLPVSTYLPGSVVSLSDGSFFRSGYLYMLPGATAVVELPAIDVEISVEGDTTAFILRNTSPFTYNGTVRLDVNASSGPSYCAFGPTYALCKVRLSPGEERIIKFKGRPVEREELLLNPPEKDPPPPTLPEDVPVVVKRKVIDEFDEVLDRLKSYWRKAEELNVTDLLPFNETFLRNMERLSGELRPVALPLLQRTEERLKTDAETYTKLLEELSGQTDMPDVKTAAALAKKSLLTGDYITPLVLSRTVTGYLSSGSGTSLDLRLLVLLIVAGVAAYLVKLPREARKKRVPRF